ncbi:MAG: hypothetical protein P4M11_01850 [Candidatus Pacebacteria bacterium]|nr:hypothetical protein [Candidatus Paceibacterota bacterium]
MEIYGKEVPENMSALWKRGPRTYVKGEPVQLIFRYATPYVIS